ncbi:will die slowly-like protein [Dermatophagoides farinae]|uniref:Will die slowly-like protein n=1 Tax=Dermatophagoides farinae TaxID=6954 RepID=A0A9D4P2L7_DERFA|nr:will die slowly-like protein [Dermatophagoides farinae]
MFRYLRRGSSDQICKCITDSLSESNNRCPQCTHFVDQFFPNYLLNELAVKYKRIKSMEQELAKTNPGKGLNDVQKMVVEKSEQLDIKEIDQILTILNGRKKDLETKARISQNELLKEFLTKIAQKKREQCKLLQSELLQIDDDYKRLIQVMESEKNSSSPNINELSEEKGINKKQTNSPISFNSITFGACSHQQDDTSFDMNALFEMRRKKMNFYFDDLEKCYLNYCKRDNYLADNLPMDRMDEFRKDLNQFTLYSQIRPLAVLNYSKESSNIVSSIEFDKDAEFFAIAGVAKKIRIFDYADVIKESLGTCYPISDIDFTSKISCLNWNSYHKAMMASSDYEGNVIIWDAFLGQKLNLFQEHEKRCWSVDFNKIDSNIVASGSDDCTVKLWSTNMELSIATLNTTANICSVKFNPKNLYYLAFASADHNVYYYDLRTTKSPLLIFKGHNKAVSYVKFLNEKEIVSASTDSQIKLWTTEHSNCIHSYRGHLNDKNFVGLTTNDDFFACGSENNSLYVYYKGIEKQMLSYSFNIKSEKEDVNDFCSAVCWRNLSNVIVAANSQGVIMILELV